MTTTTYQGTSQDVWSVLFDNRKYKDLLDEVNKLIEDTKRLYKQGYRLEAIDEQQKPKVTELENKFKQFATDRLNEIEQRCNEIEKESQQDNVKDPQTEIIKRQNLEARLSFYNDSEIVDYINSKDVTNTDIYELSLLQQKYDNQLNESQQRQVAFKLEEYNNLMFEYSVINQTGMAKTGVVITKNEQYGGVEIKQLTERYKNAIDEVKQSNNRR